MAKIQGMLNDKEKRLKESVKYEVRDEPPTAA